MNANTKTKSPRLRRFLAGGILVSLVLAGALLVAGAVAKWKLAKDFPPPGRLIEVNGIKLHLHCIGAGEPTVVLDAGGNDFSLFWGPVQQELAKNGRACAYDRGGLGWSEPAKTARTSSVIVDELRALLRAADVRGPHLLVGHSLGGAHMRLYAQRYPEEVVGLVLVDAAHPEQMLRVPALNHAVEQAKGQFATLTKLGAAGLLALAPENIPTRGLPAREAAQYRALLATKPFFAGALAETQYMADSLAEVRNAGVDQLAHLPMVVISRGRADPFPNLSETENAQYEKEWRRMQSELASLSSRANHVIAERSGHYIQLEQPELVVEAVRRIAGTPQPQKRH